MNLQTATLMLQISTALYFLSMAGYIHYLFSQKEFLQKTAFYLISAAVLCHFASVGIFWAAAGYFPAQNLSQNLSLAALLTGCMFWFFHYRMELKILGLFVSALLSGIMVAVLLLPQGPVEQNELLKGFWFYSHILLVFSGEAALALACGAGILYLLQEKGIKSKNPGFFFNRLPSLDFLDNAGYYCLSIGFALLTVGLVTGFIYAKAVWGKFWSWDPKEVASVGTWAVYATLLHLRLYSGWRGRNSAIITIAGFLIIIFTFLGVNLLLGGHHQGFTK